MNTAEFDAGLRGSLRDLRRDGVCVVRGALSPMRALRAYRGMVAWVEQTQTRFALDDPATHPGLEGVKRGGMHQHLGAGNAGFMHDLRAEPRVLRALALAAAAMEGDDESEGPERGSEDGDLDPPRRTSVCDPVAPRERDTPAESAAWARRLVASLDGFNLLPPPEVWGAFMATRTRARERDWMHLDQAFYETPKGWDSEPLRVEGFRGVQGMVVLQPIRAGDAEFECVPGAFRHHSELLARAGARWAARAPAGRGNIPQNWHVLEPEDFAFLAEKLGGGPERRHVQAEPGDIVVWDSRTPHKGSFPRADRDVPRTRAVAYITVAPRRPRPSAAARAEHEALHPPPDVHDRMAGRNRRPVPGPSRYSDADRRRRLTALACGDTMSHWPGEFCKAFSYQPRAYAGRALGPVPARRAAARQQRAAAVRGAVKRAEAPTPENLHRAGVRAWYVDACDDVLGRGHPPLTHTQLMLAGLSESEADFVESLREEDDAAPAEDAPAPVTDAQILALFGIAPG